MKGVARCKNADRVLWPKSRKNTWFWRGIFVSAVANSLLATADFNIETRSFSADLNESLDLYTADQREKPTQLREVELRPVTEKMSSEFAKENETSTVVSEQVVLPHVRFSSRQFASQPVVPKQPEAKVESLDDAHREIDNQPVLTSQLLFPSDVPKDEVLRVSKTFYGLVQESLRDSPGMASRKYVGSLGQKDRLAGDRLEELETFAMDDAAESDDSFVIGQDVDSEVVARGFDPTKNYTVVNGRVHAVLPVQPTQTVARSTGVFPTPMQGTGSRSQSIPTSSGQQIVSTVETNQSKNQDQKQFDFPNEEIKKGLNSLHSSDTPAAPDSNPKGLNRVTVRGRVRIPAGFALDRTLLRVAGTGFQIQTDASGAFELRDVPKNTRFELLVWHMDGGLTRRLVPVVASSRETLNEITLQRTSEVDQIAAAFSTTQNMTTGGFCARVEHETPAAISGGRVLVFTAQKLLEPHFFSNSGFPSSSNNELSEDGRFCVFNIEDSLVDVRVTLANGARRQFTIHVEPSTFEHDLNFDLSESFYRKVSVLEPLDTRRVLELTSQGLQPEFGDQHLRDWISGKDVPVWTLVSRFLMQTDPTYAEIRPKQDDVQYFPGGQELIELKIAADLPGAPVSRILLSRDQLLSKEILKQIQALKSKIYQDHLDSVSVPVLDADAWDEIVSENDDLPHLKDKLFGGVYLSVDLFALGVDVKDLVMSVRHPWTGQDVCQIVPLRSSTKNQSKRYQRAVCAARPGQYTFIVENRDGALLWSDVVRIRGGDVQTVTVLDPKF